MWGLGWPKGTCLKSFEFPSAGLGLGGLSVLYVDSHSILSYLELSLCFFKLEAGGWEPSNCSCSSPFFAPARQVFLRKVSAQSILQYERADTGVSSLGHECAGTAECA